ncbi:LOW QUALITY PROTEIN: hypothetical protein OSB04_013779 [Centaurea solstitialis]|uniref:Protein kinase domain-containing protein n=1 Tax=Centaurea solstitialis TaxID=347529 RepID=A0AA38TQK8_9ASTR|nr:LOW QUALITY PROTEIN: hypothetical protein OSB04_013779 [Centaurea solstitialis]
MMQNFRFLLLLLLLLSHFPAPAPATSTTTPPHSLSSDHKPTLTASSSPTGLSPPLPLHRLLRRLDRRPCTNNRVTAVYLPSIDLRGQLDSLSSLDQLRILDLRHNRLNGTLLPLANCTNLKLLYLAGNDLSGEIPTEFRYLTRLLRIDLSDNNLRGPIPDGIGNLTRLLTLRLETTRSPIPNSLSSLSEIKQLNLSNNAFYGHLPEDVARRFGSDSFYGNKGLCGSSPLPACSAATPPPTVESNPSSLPTTTIIDESKKPSRKGLHPGVIVAIVISNSVLLLVIASFLIAYYCGNRSMSSNSKLGSEIGKSRSSYGSESRVYANNGGNAGGGESDGSGKLVFFDKKKKFELEDLLRASAEMLGKGSLGTVYRAVLDDGCTVVAVKRLKDANPCGRKEFEQYMDVIGKVKHPNVVKLRAYYYAKEKSFLFMIISLMEACIYSFMVRFSILNSSILILVLGVSSTAMIIEEKRNFRNRGPGRIPLDWTTRISLVLGAARGLARIHEQYKASRIPHGNVRSSNVLLDKNGVACISDFGLSLLLNPAHATARLGGYKAPEQFETKRLSQKADVYSFGILLLEMLTGRAPSQYPSPSRVGVEEEEQVAVDLPKWVRSVVRDEWTAEVFDQELLRYKNIEEELVSMLHVAMTCVAALPEKRPTMAEVAKMIEEIRVEQSPLGEDYDESRNSMSPSVATTED